jgi:hypothetical protein
VAGSCALRLIAPRSSALTDIVVLAKSLTGLNAMGPTKQLGLFRRLGRALANS